MAVLCEHNFEVENPNNPGYSMTEVDLAAKLGMTIRKNLKTELFEIIKIKNKEVQYDNPDLMSIVRTANELEDANYLKVKCGSLCFKRKHKCYEWTCAFCGHIHRGSSTGIPKLVRCDSCRRKFDVYRTTIKYEITEVID